MKKGFLTAALIIFGIAVSTNTMAQDNFAIGIKAGYNSSKFTTDNAANIFSGNDQYTLGDIKEEAKAGYQIGGFARFKIVNNLSFQPELLYTKKGGKTTDGQNATINTTFYTWDIPLLAHLNIIDLKIAKIYGVAGPVASFNVNEDNNVSSMVTREENIRTAQWNFQAGGGVEVGRLNFDVRYAWGLTDASTRFERVNNNLTFSVGYRLFGL